MNNKRKKNFNTKNGLFHNDKSLRSLIVYAKSIWLHPPLGFD